ncbi:uncharacterized protein Bfra_012303 [Botrytis fragariae]|uniref:Uncharacterized protein n=1 Tax=Botrytis fragariae TaxID=1964551 RepID=A0A8H6AJW4_9HELO|nr:uncharacterized protein Bfra_012303 [Botrytis fragariae]KAF5868655.1 hypothetical protein Bfra_012303 [Botrytis fragariae]
MFSEESAAKAQPSPKDTTPGITLPYMVMGKSASESEDPKSNAHPPQFQFPDLGDSKKSDIFMEATLKVLCRMVFPYNEDKIRTISPILDEYLSIWPEICVDKSNIYRSKIEKLCTLDLNLMTALVATQEKRDELWLESNGYEDHRDDEETPEFREVYCPNCDESSEEDENEDLCHCPIHPNTGTEYLACGITTNPWKNGPLDGDKEPVKTTATCSAREMAAPKIHADEDDCGCLCVTCCASRGLDSDDDSYVFP